MMQHHETGEFLSLNICKTDNLLQVKSREMYSVAILYCSICYKIMTNLPHSVQMLY